LEQKVNLEYLLELDPLTPERRKDYQNMLDTVIARIAVLSTD